MSRPTTAVTLTAGNPFGKSPSGGEGETSTSQMSSSSHPQKSSSVKDGLSKSSLTKGKGTKNPSADESITSVQNEHEVFVDSEQPPEFVRKRFTPRGRNARRGVAFTRDFQVGKIGVLSLHECDQLEDRMMSSFNVEDGEELTLADRSLDIKDQFLTALHMYLAINGGSVGNTTGRLGVMDDSEPLRFADVEVSAVEVAALLGDKAYAYMRARATEIRNTLESMFATAASVNAEDLFPGVCYAAGLVKVVAARRGLSQYPQYAAVGSEYAANVPPFLLTIIMQSSAATLEAKTSDVRASRVPAQQQQHQHPPDT